MSPRGCLLVNTSLWIGVQFWVRLFATCLAARRLAALLVPGPGLPAALVPGPWPLAPGPRPLGPRPPAPRPPARRRPPFFSGVGYACTSCSLDQPWLSLRCRLLQFSDFYNGSASPGDAPATFMEQYARTCGCVLMFM